MAVHVDRDRRDRDGAIGPAQRQADVVDAGRAIRMARAEEALEGGAGLVRRAVGLMRAARAVAPIPLEAGAIELLELRPALDRKSTRLNSSHQLISYAVFC